MGAAAISGGLANTHCTTADTVASVRGGLTNTVCGVGDEGFALATTGSTSVLVKALAG